MSRNSHLASPALCILIADRPTELSQRMHNAGFRELQLPFSYSACDVVDTAGALTSMRVLGIRGASLTIPHKELAFPLVDSHSPEAEVIGAINTVINDGISLRGENTDWRGVVDALNEGEARAGARFLREGRAIRKDKVLVIGAGGAARAGIYALQQWGAKEVLVTNRSEARGREVASSLGAQFVSTDELVEVAPKITVVVNSTPVGSHLGGQELLPLAAPVLSALRPDLVFDMVTRETPFTEWGLKAGAITVLGARMLLFQALVQFELFTGQAAPQSAMERALNDALNAPS